MSDSESSLEGSEHTAGGSQSEPHSRPASPGNIDSPGTLGRDPPSTGPITPLSLSSSNLMQEPPSTRPPPPEVNPRVEEIRQALNDQERHWRDQCENIAPQLALLSTVSQWLNWNNGQFDPTSFLSMASTLESSSQQFCIRAQ
jgi:hypothetical protein